MAAESKPLEPAPEPRREKFKQVSKLPTEPRSDIAIETEQGIVLRERVQKVTSPHGVSLIFTFTRLNKEGEVMTDSEGKALVTDPHEVVLTAEDVIRVGAEEVEESLKIGREVAVARAVNHFKGLEKLPSMLTDILASRI